MFFRMLPSLLLGALMMPPSGWLCMPVQPAAFYPARGPSGVRAVRRRAQRLRRRGRSRR